MIGTEQALGSPSEGQSSVHAHEQWLQRVLAAPEASASQPACSPLHRVGPHSGWPHLQPRIQDLYPVVHLKVVKQLRVWKRRHSRCGQVGGPGWDRATVDMHAAGISGGKPWQRREGSCILLFRKNTLERCLPCHTRSACCRLRPAPKRSLQGVMGRCEGQVERALAW